MNSKKTGECEYCNREGDLIAEAGENGIKSDLFICSICKRLLSSKSTALPLIRGHMSFSARGKGEKYRKNIEKFMGMISEWNPKN